MRNFYGKYFKDYSRLLGSFLESEDNYIKLNRAIGLLKNAKRRRFSVFLIGNGGSAAIAEHMAIDFTKNAGLRAMAISGSPMLTTFSNDYGYERVFEKAIENFAERSDILVAISSSGASKNILNACKAARSKGMKIITFSGFSKDNPLRKQGDINLWVGSRAFGYVEMIHNLLIHYINDAIIGKAEYMIR